MSKERFQERQTELRKALSRLVEGAALPEDTIVRDATIHRFEYTFELLWKTLQLHFAHEGLECPGPRSALKKAFAANLIHSGDNSDLWLRMLEDRNLTRHTYDEALANQIYIHIVQNYAPALGEMVARIEALTWD